MEKLLARVLENPEIDRVPVARELAPVYITRTGLSSAGYPYLPKEAFEHFRDRVPHVLNMGGVVLQALEHLISLCNGLASPEQTEDLKRSEKVIRVMLNTACITSPPDLWLLRHVLGALQEVGLLERLLAGERIDPQNCLLQFWNQAQPTQANPQELENDLNFLWSRGYLQASNEGYQLASGQRARQVLEKIQPLPPQALTGVAHLWSKVFGNCLITSNEVRMLTELCKFDNARQDFDQLEWIATCEEIELGYLLVPIVLGLRACEHTIWLVGADAFELDRIATKHPELVEAAFRVLTQCGYVEKGGGANYRATTLGQRLFQRAPGPFGIIEAYQPYMSRLISILHGGRESVWVNRSTNIAASQDANRATFKDSNDALDEFCQKYDFQYQVFIEHALGRGEATRQRFALSGDQGIQYFGADLEDAAIDAAVVEREAGNLPSGMIMVRNADIGEPASLISHIRASGVSTENAVMVVGNGFHEVRHQTDAKMRHVFEQYCQAGIVLIFTEANALTIEDLLATAWNTYHAGFMYVHEKSGQGLRPAEVRPTTRQRNPMRASWTECATAAGYLRMRDLSPRSRTVYPYPQEGDYNPCITDIHFMVPRALANRLGIVEPTGTAGIF